MAKFPLKTKAISSIMPPLPLEEVVGHERIETHYAEALKEPHRYKKEAVLYDLHRELNNTQPWRDLCAGWYVPGPYHETIITEPKRRELSIPQLRDRIVQLTTHEELQNLFRPVFLNRSFACQYGRGPVRAVYNVQHDLKTTYRKWGDAAVIIKIDVKKLLYSIDRTILKRIIAKRFGAIKKKRPERYDDLPWFYKLLVAVIDSSPEGERGIPLGNVSSQDMVSIYPNELDQYCVRYLGIKFYTQYMDDAVIVAPDKETTQEWPAKIKAYLVERLHLETNQKIKIFYTRRGMNAYGFEIKGTHLLLHIETKWAVKRRTKKMMEKMHAGEIMRKEVEQATYSWLGFARRANAYTLCKRVLVSCRFIKVEGEMLYSVISWSCKARKLSQKRHNPAKTHKTVET